MTSGSKRLVFVGFCIVLLFGLIFSIQYVIRQNRDTRSRASSTGLLLSCGVSTAAVVKPCGTLDANVGGSADVQWHFIQYVCTDDPTKTLNLIGDGTTCRDEADLRAEADQMCQRFCPRPTPTTGAIGGGIVPTVATIGGGGGGIPVVTTAPGTIVNPIPVVSAYPPVTSPVGGLPGGGQQPSCPTRSQGDCDCNGRVQIASDFECWRKQATGEALCFSADFNFDLKCSLIDYEMYRRNALAGL